MRFSIGRSIYGPVDDVIDVAWDEFGNFLADAAQIPCDPADKANWWWVSNMLLRAPLPGDARTSRHIENIERIAGWMGFDIDHGTSLPEIKLALFGAPTIAYTTASSKPDDQSWRVMVQVSREMTISEFARSWGWFAMKFPTIDPACKNCNRIYFLPAEWTGADNIFWQSHGGRPIDVDSILAMMPPLDQPQLEVPMIDLRPAPDGTDIILPHWIALAQTQPAGRRLYRLMCYAAKRFRENGWELSAQDLANAALAASQQFAPNVKRPKLLHEAENALRWGRTNIAVKTPMERIRSRILWEQTRRFR